MKASSAVFGEPAHFSQARLRRQGELVSVRKYAWSAGWCFSPLALQMNEPDVKSLAGATLSHTQVRQLVDAARQPDPDAVITVSSGGGHTFK